MTDSDTTTIQLHRDTKQLLDARKQPGESYDTAVRRLIDGHGVLWTEPELRELVRDEVQSMRP